MSDSKPCKCEGPCSCEFQAMTSQSLARWNEQAAQVAIVATQNFVASQNAAQQQMLLAMFPLEPLSNWRA